MVKKSASTGNLESLVGAIFGGASHANTHVVIETSRSDELRLKESSSKDKKHQHKKRSSSRPRLNGNGNGNSNPETTVGRTKQRRSRSKSHTRTLSSNGSTASASGSGAGSGVAYPFDVSGIDIEEMDAKLQQLPLKSEQELMADIFRTAEELEDLAKAARRARRRKSGRHPLKRSKSNLSEASISDGSGRSIASSKNSSIASVLLSPFVSTTSHHEKREKPARRRSFNVSLMGRHSSHSCHSHNHNNHNNSNNSTTRQQKEREKEMPHVSKRLDLRPFELPNHMQYKPSFYHDSDDEDDDLVLDPNEDLNEFSRQVQQDVQNMMITVVTVANFDNN